MLTLCGVWKSCTQQRGKDKCAIMVMIVNRIDSNMSQVRKLVYRYGQLLFKLEKTWVMKATSGLTNVYGTMDLMLEKAQWEK